MCPPFVFLNPPRQFRAVVAVAVVIVVAVALELIGFLLCLLHSVMLCSKLKSRRQSGSSLVNTYIKCIRSMFTYACIQESMDLFNKQGLWRGFWRFFLEIVRRFESKLLLGQNSFATRIVLPIWWLGIHEERRHTLVGIFVLFNNWKRGIHLLCTGMATSFIRTFILHG